MAFTIHHCELALGIHYVPSLLNPLPRSSPSHPLGCHRSPALGSLYRPSDSYWLYILHMAICMLGFPGGVSGKEPVCQCRSLERWRFNPWDGKIPWKRAWQPTPVFLPREFHSWSLAAYSPWGRTESDTTAWLSTDNVYVPMLFSHIIPPSPSPLFTRVSSLH